MKELQMGAMTDTSPMLAQQGIPPAGRITTLESL